MNIINPRTIKDFIAKFRSDVNKSQTLISAGANNDEFSYTNYTKTDFQKLENAYKDFSVFASVNLLSENIYGSGFKFVGGAEPARLLLNNAYNTTSFKPALVDGIKDVLIYGVGYNEVLLSDDKKDITGLKIISVKSLEPKWDGFGNITGYVQTQNEAGKKVKLDKDKVLFYRFFRSSDNVFGIGLVEPIYHLLEIRQDMVRCIRDIFKFLAFPPVQIVKQGAQTKAELDKAEKQFKDFHRKNYFVTSEKYEIKMLEVRRALPDLSKYIEQIDNFISIGLRVPSRFLSGDITIITKASALALRQYAQDEISYIRIKLTWILQEQFVKPICAINGFVGDDVPRLVWIPDISEDPKIKSEVLLNKIKVIVSMLESGLISKERAEELTEKSIIEKM